MFHPIQFSPDKRLPRQLDFPRKRGFDHRVELLTGRALGRAPGRALGRAPN